MTNTVTACNTVNLLDKTTYDQQVRPDTELWAVDEESDSDYKSMVVGWGMPDYSAGVDVSGYTSSSNQFTAPCNGWIAMSKSIHARFYINGVEFTRPSNSDYGGDNCVIPMPKNTTYYGAANATFYPCIGG